MHSACGGNPVKRLHSNLRIAAVITAPDEEVCGAYFCHRPLVSWSIVHAQCATTVETVFLQTDSDHIRRIAEDHGVSVIHGESIDRQNASGTISGVWADAAEINDFDLLVVLPASAPLRHLGDIDRAVRTAIDTNADVVVSGTSADASDVWMIATQGHLQALSDSSSATEEGALFVENGAILVLNLAGTSDGNDHPHVVPLRLIGWQAPTIGASAELWECEGRFRQLLLPELEEDAQAWLMSLTTEVDLVVYDFDGVMTDNRVWVNEDGIEAVFANRADGLGVERIRRLGIPQLILSTETNPVVSARATKLRLPVIQGSTDKKEALLNHCRDHSIDPCRVLFVGNDVNDATVMEAVGWPVAPSDAHESIKRTARIITKAQGGGGVIKELAERFFRDG